MKFQPPNFFQARVLVIGDLMLDRYWHGATARISPEAPVPVVNIDACEERPGGAANVALNIAALGAQVTLLGMTGADAEAQVLQQTLQAASIQCDFCVLPHMRTITKLRVISHQQQLIRLDFEQNSSDINTNELLSKIKTYLNWAQVILLSDYGKGVLKDAQAIVQLARAHNIPVLVDPKGKDFSKYQQASLITPNLTEFEAVVGRCDNEAELITRGRQLIQALQIQALLITRGERGMTLLQSTESELHLPARAREVYDVTGAGDTVIAVIAAALAAKAPLSEAVILSNLAASIVVGKLGTAVVSAPELRRAVQKEQGAERGVLTESQLLLAIEDARAQGESIVMTNGCFDILHAGHVTYLEQAKQLGSRLIVAVNSDHSIKKIKGEGRPVNALERRMAVLAGLNAVDWVVAFSEDTPERLLKLIKPDILVKGGDYKLNAVVGADIVKGYGGQVKVLAKVDECSTTAILNKIRQ